MKRKIGLFSGIVSVGGGLALFCSNFLFASINPFVNVLLIMGSAVFSGIGLGVLHINCGSKKGDKGVDNIINLNINLEPKVDKDPRIIINRGKYQDLDNLINREAQYYVKEPKCRRLVKKLVNKR